MIPIRDRIVSAIDDLRRYHPAEAWTADEIADKILVEIPEIRGLDGLQCRDCGGNLTELDVASRDGLCTLCRDIAEAVPA